MINDFDLDKCNFFKPGLRIHPTDFNLFIGPNGSGKTRLLRNIYRNAIQQERRNIIKPVFIDESRFYNGKLSYANGHIALTNIENTTNIAAKTPEKDQLNEDLLHLFNRKVEILTSINGKQAPHFTKNKKDVLTKDDGRGIVNAWTVFEYVAFAPNKLPLFVEELSIGLHPSILTKYLDKLFKRLHSKTMQLFATTQDPFTVFYFLKNKLDEELEWNDTNPEYSVFNLSENDGLFSIEKITKENIYSSMDSLMGDFNHSGDRMKFDSLFAGKSPLV